jgi:hypothetical protein
MPTTKKVAPTSIAKTPLKRSAVSKTKKTAAVKKGASIPVSVKAAPKKKATSLKIKNNTGKITEIKKTKTTIAAKLQKVEDLHSKKPVAQNQVRAHVSQKKIQPKKLPMLRKPLVPAVLSPFRFPIDAQKLARNTARYGGIVFMLLGAVFTLFFADATLSSKGQLAALATVNQQETQTDQNTTAIVENKYPTASFTVNNPQALTGSVQVKISVPNAESVSLLAYYKTQNENITIGQPTKVSADTWEIYWNTSSYDDGEYRLKALIKNSFGTYEVVDSKYVFVKNTATVVAQKTDTASTTNTTTNAVASTDTTTEVSDDTQIDELLPAYIKVITTEYTSEFLFEVKANSAEKVKVYAKNLQTDDTDLIGYAYKATNSTWKYRWELDDVPAGRYRVTAYAIADGREFESNSVTVTVDEVQSEVSIQTVDSVPKEPVLAPEITISIPPTTPLTKIVPVAVSVEDAQSVELYLLPKNSLVQRFAGSANRVDTDMWTFRWDTEKIPNGDYQVLAYVKNANGTYFEQSSMVTVTNKVVAAYTDVQQEQIKTLTSIAESEPTVPALTYLQTKQNEDQTDAPGAEAIGDEDQLFQEILDEYMEQIEEELQRLASALRLRDGEAVDTARTRIEELKQDISRSEVEGISEQRIFTLIDMYLSDAVKRVEADVERVEKLIVERTSENAILDSDKDGISDYDEVNIYTTNPFAADSDADGFIDGLEIMNGFDPLDPSSETIIAYESPKETGVVRNDILEIHSVITAQKNEGETTPAALISGKALPNSFITLYIFSTPVVVTVKTAPDGNWNYRFDKELEDGQHEVYIGVTDNAGKLVAKSSPFPFVKEAEAFGPITGVTPQPATSESSFVSQYMIYLVLSISVVAIGLVLILLGLYLDSRQRKFGTIIEGSEVRV